MGRKRIELDFHKKYGRLTLLSIIKGRYTMYRCLCNCGKEIKVRADNLSSGATKSCGCLQKETISKTGKDNKGHNKIHGMYGTPEYAAWGNMKTRCYNTNTKQFKDYGGRGIKVCDRWLESFDNFFSDVGEKPKPKFLYSLDRINNDGNYEPDNCKWSTRKQQEKNQRKYKK